MPNLPFKNKVDVIIEITIDNLILQSEEQARNYFYSALWNNVKSFMQSKYNKDLKKAGVVIVTPTAMWTQFYDFSSDCGNCDKREHYKSLQKEEQIIFNDKREHIIDWGVATPTVTYTFGPGAGGGTFSYSYTADFRSPSLVGMSAFGMAKRSGQWHGNRFQF